MKNIFHICTALLLCSCTVLRSQDSKPSDLGNDARASYRAEQERANSKYRGWDFVVEKLRDGGVSDDEINHIYKSPKLPRFEHVPFSLAPKESPDMYSGYLAGDKLQRAQSFSARNRDTLNRAESLYGVSSHIITAVLLVESDFGRNTGREIAIHRLSRLLATADPENQEWNYQRLRRENPAVRKEQVEGRAGYLEKLFLPEIISLIELSRENQIDIFEIKGSRAGALGMPQFLPTTYRKYALDGDKDGRISLFREADSIASIANFLQAKGWERDRSWKQNRQALWEYNRSDAYVNTVFKVAQSLATPPKKAPAVKKPALVREKPLSDFSLPSTPEEAQDADTVQPSLSEKMRDAISDWSQQNSF